MSRASLRVSTLISGNQWSVGGVSGGPPPGGFSLGPGRGGAVLGRAQGSESEFPSCASAASKVRARPLSGRADLTFRGLRGGSSATSETRVSAGRGGSGVRGRRMAASSSLVEAELQCGTVSKIFFFYFGKCRQNLSSAQYL